MFNLIIISLKAKKIFLISTLALSSFGAFAGGFNEATCIRFCDEPLPIYDHKILKNFESAMLHTGSMPLLRIKPQAERFFKVIDPILKQYQLPLDLKYLVVVESSLNAKAISHKGAYGYWQFMPHTAQAMGLEVSNQKDEREDLIKSTHAACKYFLSLYRELGSWSLVAAAYNAGPTKVKNYLKAHGQTSYYHLRISRENQKYLYRVLAAKELLTRANLYTAVIAEEVSMIRFMAKSGLALGLIPAPIIKRKAMGIKDFMFKNLQSTFDEALITGFDEIVPVTFKRGQLLSFVPKTKEIDSEVTHNSEERKRLALWRNTLRTTHTRRNDLKALLAQLQSTKTAKQFFKMLVA
jgi:hypothetical protein